MAPAAAASDRRSHCLLINATAVATRRCHDDGLASCCHVTARLVDLILSVCLSVCVTKLQWTGVVVGLQSTSPDVVVMRRARTWVELLLLLVVVVY